VYVWDVLCVHAVCVCRAVCTCGTCCVYVCVCLQGCVYVWDVEKGMLIRRVPLGSEGDHSQFVRQLVVSADSSPVIVADYGSQLCLVRFTSVLEKDD